MKQPDLDGRAVLITGGTAGIGKATAQLFLEQGARVMIAGRREREGAEAVQELRKISPDIHFLAADVSRSKAVQSLVKETVQRFGGLDILFNNAGIEGRFSPLDEMEENDMEAVLGVNV